MRAGKVSVTSPSSKAETLLQAAGSEPGGCQTSFVLTCTEFPCRKLDLFQTNSLLDSREELYALPLFTQGVCLPLLD